MKAKQNNISLSEIFPKSFLIYKLKLLKRFNNTHKITEESVLEHTTMVSLISLLIAEKLNIKNKEKILKMSLFHDIPETLISDIPHNVKKLYPEINKILAKIEPKALENIFPKDVEILKEYNECKTIDSKIVTLADYISVMIYCSIEIKLGNTLMRQVYTEATFRYKQLCKELNISILEEEILVFN